MANEEKHSAKDRMGVLAGLYDPDNTLQLMVFRWVFIPWLQQELDNYKNHINLSRKRHDRNKVLPQGVPELIHEFPEDYGALNFKAVFEECYTRIDSPPVTRDSVWTVYSTLLRTLQLHVHVQAVLSNVNEPLEEDNEPEIGLLPGLQELQENDEGYMGGVANGLGFQMERPDALDDSELEVEDALDDSNPDPGDGSFSDNEDAI